MKTRQTLIQKVKNKHDEHSWAEFAEIYRPYIARVLLNMNINAADCDDLIQKTLLVCWEKLPEFNYQPEKALFRTWLNTIIKNHYLTFVRGSVRHQNKTQKLQDQPQSTTTEPEIDKITEKEWKLFISQKAWENIQNDFNDKAIRSFEMISDGIEVEKIAAELDLSPGSVYVYKKRVLESLYREINKLDREYS